MSDKDLIARLAAENIELRDELKEQTESRQFWCDRCAELEKNSIPVSKVPQSIDGGVSALEKLGDPKCQIVTD
jgi:hypothetical protein